MGRPRRASPETRKKNASGKNCGLQYAVASMQGWRMEMEDNHSISLSLPGEMKNWAFGAVFDGHSGKEASIYCSRRLRKNICKIINTPENMRDDNRGNSETKHQRIHDGIIQAYLELDDRMRHSSQVDDGSGTTAVCSFISPTHFYFANCGDSRAVLCRKGRVHFATVDHKPTKRSEKKRIKKAGGCVKRKRVNGYLAMSRALGDFVYKEDEQNDACHQLVIPKPDVTVIERDFVHDEFVILACDGIWDVMSNSEVVRFVRTQMGRTNNLKEICNMVLDRCLEKNSGDNMTFALLVLPSCQEKALAQKRKLDLQQMNRAIKKTKFKSVKSKSTGSVSVRNLSSLEYSNEQSLHADSGVDVDHGIQERTRPPKTPPPFILYFLDYWKKHGGNVCGVAKHCGQRWHQFSKNERAKYEKRYRRNKRLASEKAHNAGLR